MAGYEKRIQAGKHRPSMQRPKMRTLTCSNLLIALIGFLFLTCASVVLVLNLRAIYYFDVEYLQLEQFTGIPADEIKENYDILIDYNMITGGMKNLEFPSFPMSESGRIHFEEVKQIFVGIQYLCIISCICLIPALVWKNRKKDYGSLKLISIFTVLIPVLLGIVVGFWWEETFLIFHKIFFKNDYWLFDPATDPVIWILPDVFFAHCAAAILICILLGGAMCGIICRILRKRQRNFHKYS